KSHAPCPSARPGLRVILLRSFKICLAKSRLTDARLLGFFGWCGSLREFETDLPIFQFQVGGKWASPFRDKAVEEIGFSRGEQLFRLLFGNLTTENPLA